MTTLMMCACPPVQAGFDLSLLEHSAPLLPALPTALGSLLLGSVGDRVVFKEPLLRGRGHGCKLAVKHGLFVLGHDEVLRDDHCLRKALICNGTDHRRVRGTQGPVPTPVLWEKLKGELGVPCKPKGGKRASTAGVRDSEPRTACGSCSEGENPFCFQHSPEHPGS